MWTGCGCDDCHELMAKRGKLARCGKLPDQRPSAAARLASWRAAGYSAGVVSEMTGVPHLTMARHLNGDGTLRISHSNAAKVMAAPAHPTSESGYVPKVGAMRRLRALSVLGWSMLDVAERCGMPDRTLYGVRDSSRPLTFPRVASAVAVVFDELCMTPGPNRVVAGNAARKGWAPPLAWPEGSIDDPDAQPVGVGVSRMVLRVEDVGEWLEWNPLGTAAQCAERFGLRRDAVTQACRRAGREDLVAVFARNALIAA